MKAILQRVKGNTFVGKADSNHWVVLDTVKKFGGSEAGSKPMELVLIALGGCTAMDVESLLNKMRTPADDFRVEVEAENAQEHPKVFTRIEIVYKFWGENLNENNIKKAIELSQNKYCSVSAMLKKVCEITYRIEINPD